MGIPAHPFPDGPKACGSEVHVHCARCGTSDATVYAAPTRTGGHFPPLCLECSVKIMRIRAVADVEAAA